MPSHCIFCGDTDLTNEDIWPMWFKRWLKTHPELKSTFTLIYVRDDATTVLQDKSLGVGGKRRIMCLRCNTKRMGRLQKRASIVLKPMLDHPYAKPQKPIALGPTDQSVLAAWATMTAMTSEFLGIPMADNDGTFFTQPERESFRKNRRPLPEMTITCSQYVGRNATGAYFAHPRPPILDMDTLEPTGATAKLYVVTINLFHVCFQLAYWRSPPRFFSRDGRSMIGIEANPEGVTIPIWKSEGPQEWPAQHPLGDDTLLLYCQRWQPQDQ